MPQSRKAKRKQVREDKKRLKFKQQRKELAVSSSVANVCGRKPAKAPQSSKISNKFHEFLAEANSAVSNAEDQEIKALEAKLGLGSLSASKSALALKKLRKEYSKDGLGEDFADFLSELDNISEVVKGRPKVVNHLEDYKAEVGLGLNDSKADSEFEDLDEETRQEMELLQAEDAEFLKGMDELPTDESGSESESENLEQFYSDEEDSHDDNETHANTLRNQQLSAVEGDNASDGIKGKEDQISSEMDSENMDQLHKEEKDDDESDQEESHTNNEGESEEDEEKNVVVEEDIYGRAMIKSSAGIKPSAYVPPHLRRKLQHKTGTGASTTEEVKSLHMDEQEMRELSRRINGQINRISESNIESIVLEMEKIYRANSRSVVNEILLEKLLQITCHPRQVMASLIKVGGALLAALYHCVGSEVGGFFVEKLVRKLVESAEEAKKQLIEFAEQDNDVEDDTGRTSKVPVNLTVFVIMLYNYGVVHCSLVYDLFRSFVDGFTSTDIELIHQLLKIGGAQLCSDDADALHQMIAAVQHKVFEAQKENCDRQPDERVRFILDLIYDLKKSPKRSKGGKSYASGSALDISSLKKWLGRVKTRCGNANNPLRVSLQELLDADENGRWWVVGGTWVGYQRQKSTSDESNDNVTNDETDRLLKLAEKQRMNTDIRKQIFVALMGATDSFDAYERLLQLHLKEKQEREIVRVILHCCGQETKFNKFYLVLAETLCKMDPRYKFTFQLAFWDIFKLMTSSKPRKLFNQAQMLAGLVLSNTLSLSSLKVLDFTQLDEKSVLFLRVLLVEILKVESEVEMAKIFHRLLQTKKAQLTIDGLAVFFHQYLTSFRSESDDHTRTLLKKRSKSVKSLLDQLAKTRRRIDCEI
ncbi:nucleolar mif4g domain-containing protein 1 [Plasmopara halstedii]|uniref:Nucleolar mif4g domain-containing protein 1 n=1 Tax=Plasmopara halstedii TaxID=4781 RepID=A0A0N7L8A8_PLAHL|nr:nucleolar mif4g domain-containing protein 1 [Plasmopara halstedii]CEG49355.1 nucleolar mif4g domain-containing protein 1 [Plasmopara halstedii]|eukprot:XP_024585724.1 nucleolar mif4g domain-containing protein 1 [Plasmopara halstedii]